jgi:phage shock protein A
MANPFVKGWKYLMALFGAKIDEYADPKVQIQQAIEDAQRQHQALVQQAASVIGNQRQLEMKLSRTMSEVEKLGSSARQALVLADKVRAEGDEEKATQYESAATTFATQLVSAEQQMEDLKTLHDQALSAATQARKAVGNNTLVLQQKLAERTKLLSQLEQAKMQETVARSLESMSELAAPGNTPSLDEVPCTFAFNLNTGRVTLTGAFPGGSASRRFRVALFKRFVNAEGRNILFTSDTSSDHAGYVLAMLLVGAS